MFFLGKVDIKKACSELTLNHFVVIVQPVLVSAAAGAVVGVDVGSRIRPGQVVSAVTSIMLSKM